VTREGDIYWGVRRMSGVEEVVDRLKKVAVQVPQPEVQIRGDANARYEFVGRVVFACQRAGIQKIGFITEPPPRG
jgi:biopolymer transport protein ExbD